MNQSTLKCKGGQGVLSELSDALQKMLPYALLTCGMLLLMILPLDQGEFFGSQGDWYSQHISVAQALREMILDTGSIVPQYSAAGGGSNIYDFAYYGLLRPDILLSCLMPEMKMKYVIAGYALLSACVAVNLCYYWLVKRQLAKGAAFMGAAVFGSATCFFHAHHQIIFVNYLPFLILALMGLDRLLEKGKSGLLVIALFLVYIHSFFYAFSSLVVCLIYFLYRLGDVQKEAEPRGESIRKKRFILTLRAFLAVGISIGLATVLLLPTGLDILSTQKDEGAFMEQGVKLLDFSMEGLLYTSYGCGMTLLALYCLLVSLTKKKRRVLSAILLLCFAVPAVSLALNGFLYPRGKILIPFLPVLAMVCGITIEELYKEKTKALILPVFLCLIPWFFSSQNENVAILADGAFLLIWVLTIKFGKLKGEKRKMVFAIVLICPIVASLLVNTSEDYLPAIDQRQEHFSAADIGLFASDRRYRFDYLSNGYVASNIVPQADLYKTAMYSSITNDLYSQFYYDVSGNPIQSRNRVALVPSTNPFFSYFMGIRYVLANEDSVPAGYEVVFKRDGYVLAENENVLPVCYGTDQVLLEDTLSKVKFPYTLEALSTGQTDSFQMEEEKTGVLFDEEAFADIAGQNLHIPLSKSLRGELLILEFDVENPRGNEVKIKINGMQNKLASQYAPYPNENHHFTYVLDGDGDLSSLKVQASKGNYQVTNLKVCTCRKEILRKKITNIKLNQSLIDADTMFAGTITMDQKGYLATTFPYRKGYEILIDGEKQDVQQINGAFVGAKIEKGSHSVEINYVAPGYRQGKIISLGCFLALVLLLIIERKRSK